LSAVKRLPENSASATRPQPGWDGQRSPRRLSPTAPSCRAAASTMPAARASPCLIARPR